MYILVQTSRNNFNIISSVKTHLIENHKNLGYQTYLGIILVIYQCCLEHGITLEKNITTSVMTHFVFWNLGWIPYNHSIR
jgi:hypothetical protein